MNGKSKKLMIVLLLMVAMTAVMLSSCTVYYAGKYQGEVDLGFAKEVITIELSAFGKVKVTAETKALNVTATSETKEGKYKVKDKQIIITIKNEDKEEETVFNIVDRKTIKWVISETPKIEAELKRI